MPHATTGAGRQAGLILLSSLLVGWPVPASPVVPAAWPGAAPLGRAAPPLAGPVIATLSAAPPSGTPVPPGRKVRYQIHVTNSGATPLTGLAVTDAIPAGTTLLTTSFAVGTASGNGVTWTVSNLGAGQSANFAFEVQVGGVAGQVQPAGTLVNSAQVSGSGLAPVTSNQTSHPLAGSTGVIQPVATATGPVATTVTTTAPPGASPAGFVPGPGGVPLPVGLAPMGQLTTAPVPAATLTRSVSGSYNAVGGLAPTVYLPLVSGGQHGLNTAIALFNASPQANQISLQFVGPDGAPGPRDSVSLPANGSVTYTNVPAGWLGSAVLTGQTPVAAAVTFHRAGADDLAYEGVSSAAASGQGATTVFLPLLFRRYTGWSSEIAVQNAGQAPAEVSLLYRSSDPAQASVGATETATIPPGGSHLFSQNGTPNLPDNFVGGAVLTTASGQPLAAIVNLTNAGTPAAMSYTGIYATQAAPSLRAPLLMKGHNGWDTGLQVQNVGATPTTVRVDYTASGQAAASASDTAPLRSGESHTFFTPAASGLPADFVGSAVVTSDNGQPLAAVVNQTKYQLGTAMTYSALATGASTLIAPVAYKAADGGYASGVQVQNLGSAPAQVTLQFFTEPGQPAASLQDTIAVNGSATYYLPNVGQLGPGYRGSVVITSTNGQPLGAIVNDVAYQ